MKEYICRSLEYLYKMGYKLVRFMSDYRGIHESTVLVWEHVVPSRERRLRNCSSAHFPTHRTLIMKATSKTKRPILRVETFQEGTDSADVDFIPNTFGTFLSSRAGCGGNGVEISDLATTSRSTVRQLNME